MNVSQVWLASLAVGLFSQMVGQNVGADERPNVIVFIADDVSWNDYGCYGNASARTPHIDALAKSGIRFDRAYLTASSCSPSRSSIITGRYPHNNGRGAELHQPISGNIPWFPEALREAGYYTALSGKHHMKSTTKRPEPFEHVDGGRVKDNSGGHANWVQVTKQRPRDQPFFFWFAAYDAHRGWDADRQWDESRYGRPHRAADVVVPPFLVDDAATREDLASYYNEVTRFDHYIGRVMNELRQQGVADNTLVFVLADNGRPFPRCKTTIYDSGIKTPMFCYWPQTIAPGKRTMSLTSTVDIAPTILELAGLNPGESYQGRSFSKLLTNPADSYREYVFAEKNWHDFDFFERGIRSDRFKYIQNNFTNNAATPPADAVRSPSYQSILVANVAGILNDAQSHSFVLPRPAEEFYDLQNDPNELKNLAESAEFQAQKELLKKRLEQWKQETNDTSDRSPIPDQFDRKTGERIAPRR